MVLEKVKIYLDGTMLRIESDDPDFKNRSLPTGRMEAIEQGAGYTFVDGYHDTLLCSVDSFDDVLDAAGAVYGASQAAVTTALNAFLNFKQGGGGISGEIIFQEQDETTQTTSAIWINRHTFSGELAAGTYQIDSYQDLGITNLAGSLQNGIFIDTVLTAVRGQVFQLLEGKQILNRYIYVHGGGTVQIDAAFRRFTAATFAECFFSNLIIKKIG